MGNITKKKFMHCNGYRKDCGRKSLPRIKYFDRDIKTLIKKFLVVRDNGKLGSK